MVYGKGRVDGVGGRPPLHCDISQSLGLKTQEPYWKIYFSCFRSIPIKSKRQRRKFVYVIGSQRSDVNLKLVDYDTKGHSDVHDLSFSVKSVGTA